VKEILLFLAFGVLALLGVAGLNFGIDWLFLGSLGLIALLGVAMFFFSPSKDDSLDDWRE